MNNEIDKDLILSILKRNLYFEYGSCTHKGIVIIQCSLGNKHSGKDYEIIKNWLGSYDLEK